MEQKNILNEVIELLNSTNENLKFVISRSSTNYLGLLKSIRTTLTNVEKVLKRESSLNDKQRTEFEKAYFFILESGNLDAFKEYCAQNPRQKFE